jgi:hypothetical protein
MSVQHAWGAEEPSKNNTASCPDTSQYQSVPTCERRTHAVVLQIIQLRLAEEVAAHERDLRSSRSIARKRNAEHTMERN